MSKLELLIKEKENIDKKLEFGPWFIQRQHLYYKHDYNIYTILPMYGDMEITFFMSNGLTFELKLVNDKIIFTGMSVNAKPISIEYEYKWV